MKTRNGFVSNSSSSSFIINAENKFSTVRDVAKYMMKECMGRWGAPYSFDTELINLDKMSDPNTPVFFNTGDETYIRKIDDKIVIATTQNVSFDEISNISLNVRDLSDEFLKKFTYVDEDGFEITFNKNSSFEYYYNKFHDFLMLEYDVLGRHDYVSDCPYCEDKFSSGVLLENGDLICGCQIKKMVRREKLNKIG